MTDQWTGSVSGPPMSGHENAPHREQRNTMPTKIAEPEFVEFRGVKINNVHYSTAYRRIKHIITRNEKDYVCMTDVGNVIGATQDNRLREAINSSILSLADGTPLAWYAKLVGCREIERISGPELMVKMFSEREGFKHLLLGDTEHRINRVMETARKLNESVKITGYSPPFKDFDDDDNRQIMERINQLDPDLIWVSFGGGKQEKWMCQNLSELNRGVMIGVGAAFKWIVGDLKLPPRIIQKMGLQWTYRIIQALIAAPNKQAKKIVTKILKRKLVFLWLFPGEVIRARRACRRKVAETNS